MDMKRIVRICLAGLALLAFVSCSEKKTPEPGLTAFGFYAAENPSLETDYPATINGSAISVNLPGLVDKSNLIARFTTKNASDIVQSGGKAQVSGVTANNFTGAVVYSLMNEDASASASYTVTVNSDPVAAPAMATFGFYVEDNAGKLYEDYVGTISGGTVSLSMPSTVDKSGLIARFTTNQGDVAKVGTEALVSQTTAWDWSDPVDITLTNADGKLNAIYSVVISNKALTFNAAAKAVSDTAACIVLQVNPVDGQPYVAYTVGSMKNAPDRRYKANCLKYDGSAWTAVGGADFSNGVNNFLRMDFSPSGTPYLAFASNSLSPKASSVMKLDGSTWKYVDEEGLAATFGGACDYQSFAGIDDHDLAMLQFYGSRTGNFARYSIPFTTYDGSAWKSEYGVFGTTSGYIVTGTKSGKTGWFMILGRTAPRAISVVKYENKAFTLVRDAFIQEGATNTYATIRVFDMDTDPDGNLFILTADDAEENNTWKIRVEKYDVAKAEWSLIGGSTIPFVSMSSSGAACTSLAVAPDGTPYVAFCESGSNEIKVTGIDPESLSWSTPVVVANNFAPNNYNNNFSFDFSETGIGYIAYGDTAENVSVVIGK